MRTRRISRASVGLRETGPNIARTAPLSLLFAGLVTNCANLSGNCGDIILRAIDKEVVVSEAELEYFAGDDGIINGSECVALCTCLIKGDRPILLKRDAGTPLDDAGTDDGDDGAPAPVDADEAGNDGRDDVTTALDEDSGETGAGGASGDDATGLDADANQGGPGGGGGSEGGWGPVGKSPESCGNGKMAVLSSGAISWCEQRATAPNGYAFHCKGTQQLDNTCGRSGACHESLGRGFGDSDVARWLAFAAATEAASIRSFVTLRRELRALGAPPDLARRAHRAARDEAKHTRFMLRLTHERGGKVEWPRSVRLQPRALEAVATENAVEGCVHETWAALLGTYQAVHAADSDVRAVMARIATDETAHAELAHDIDRWALATLPKEARARVERRKQAAARALVARLGHTAASLQTELGLPNLHVKQAFARELTNRLWS